MVTMTFKQQATDSDSLRCGVVICSSYNAPSDVTVDDELHYSGLR